MNKTIEYYNTNASKYYSETVNVDLDQMRRKFADYLPEHARVIDIGCGSGRDVKAFLDMGLQAVGLDASEELAQVASEGLGIHVIVEDMSTWLSDEPYDGIWCCASLLHLREQEVICFFNNLHKNLKPGGAIYISVKTGIPTGLDEKGRYMKNFTEDELEDYLKCAGIEIAEKWNSGDQMNREGFYWINVIGVRKE